MTYFVKGVLQNMGPGWTYESVPTKSSHSQSPLHDHNLSVLISMRSHFTTKRGNMISCGIDNGYDYVALSVSFLPVLPTPIDIHNFHATQSSSVV